jgi:hypothetical protein
MTTDACDLPAATLRWGGVVPAAVVLALVASRFAAPDRARAAAHEATALSEKATRAQTGGHFADAAEYARHAAARTQGPARAHLLCLRAESLVRDGRGPEAQQAFAEAGAAGATCAPPSRVP